MALSVKEDVTLDPIDVGILCANAVVLAPNRRANLIEKFGFGRHVEYSTDSLGWLVLKIGKMEPLIGAGTLYSRERGRIIVLDTTIVLIFAGASGV